MLRCSSKNPEHVAYRQAVLDAFLPLGRRSKQDIGDEDDPDALTKKALTLKVRKQRAIIPISCMMTSRTPKTFASWLSKWSVLWRVFSFPPSFRPAHRCLLETGGPASLLWFGLSECCHSMLSATIREYLSPKVQAAQGQLQQVALATGRRFEEHAPRLDDDFDEDDEQAAAMRRETDALTSNVDWTAALKLRMKQKALAWFQQDILPALVAINIAVGPLSRLFGRTPLDKGSTSWEKVQQAKAANDCARTFPMLEAARGTDLRLIRADIMKQAFHEHVVPLPFESCLQHVQTLRFRMLSRSLCSVEVHLTSWSTCRIKSFLALGGQDDAKLDTPCLVAL